MFLSSELYFFFIIINYYVAFFLFIIYLKILDLLALLLGIVILLYST